MNENRKKILQMLAAGQITADEAERLLMALETESSEKPGAGAEAAGASKAKPKYVRVLVTEQDRHGDPVNVNVRVPIQLLRWGVKLNSLIPLEARDRVNSAMRKEGVAFDLGQMKPENLDELIDHLDDLTVDIDDKKKTKVRIFCE
jgi:hypothetical protein